MASNTLDLSEKCSREKSVDRRAAMYKKPTRNSFNPDFVDATPQEIRRQRLLSEQKRNRDAEFNLGRGLLDDVVLHDDDEFQMDCQQNNRWHRRRDPRYANQLMMSEWMLEVPPDLMEKWLVVPCPQGHRTLLIARKGQTRAYNKRGVILGKFNSALPGGMHQDNRNSCTILDCIWSKDTKKYYTLDVLAWSNQPMLNCDTEFRRFWLNTRLQEMSGLIERESSNNHYPILPLPSYPCNGDLLEFSACLTSLPPLDGLLFYHKETHYTQGRTPLVTWLKPFMVPEVFQGHVLPSIFYDKPDNYVDMKSFIEEYNRKSKKNKKIHESPFPCCSVFDTNNFSSHNESNIVRPHGCASIVCK